MFYFVLLDMLKKENFRKHIKTNTLQHISKQTLYSNSSSNYIAGIYLPYVFINWNLLNDTVAVLHDKGIFVTKHSCLLACVCSLVSVWGCWKKKFWSSKAEQFIEDICSNDCLFNFRLLPSLLLQRYRLMVFTCSEIWMPTIDMTIK